MRRRMVMLLVAALLLAGLAGPAMAQTGKSVSIAFDQEPDSLNPMYTTMTFAGYVYQLFLTGAWNFDADLNPHAVMVAEIPSADNGGINEDGTVMPAGAAFNVLVEPVGIYLPLVVRGFKLGKTLSCIERRPTP